MPNVVIENPVLNSPYEEPLRHFKFETDGITDQIVERRRPSEYFMPVPAAKKKGSKQLTFGTEWTEDRIEPNEFTNRVRARVAQWRQGGHVGVTATTRRLLEYWTRPDRERRLFFCQIEAAETAIYLAEVAHKYGDSWIENDLRKFAEDANPLLFRIGLKMATGSGKTAVMAMLIAWQVLNKAANRQDARFADAFLIVTPGITVRDRLRVLLPNDVKNDYKDKDLVPPDLLQEMAGAKIVITNFHAFLPREKVPAGRLTKQVLLRGQSESAFTETKDQMVRRVCADLGSKRNIVVINDEAHHCYRRRVGDEDVKLTGDERREAERRDEEARVWISGLEAVKDKLGVKTVYDLSATPFFLRGSGYQEGTLFPWIVSDFSLIDAIESGIVKVPRVPVSDNQMTSDMPTYRNLWAHIREDLPKKGRKTDALSGPPKLPVEMEGALQSLYANYKKRYEQWEQAAATGGNSGTPPVFIIVCNNTNVSKLVFDYVAGWAKDGPDGSSVLVPGALDIFSNVRDDRWLPRPNTILVDSEQLESGGALTPDFRKIAGREIEELKDDYRRRFPGRDVSEVSDEDLLREVLNSVGKPGRLGEQVKCVVSVSMLTEGWDANTVTHILGVRAFGTQLLCEQVVGRALRRISYLPNPDGKFEPEYAEVYGVPFSFIPCAGSTKEPKPGRNPTRVRALEDRTASEITFPRLTGYRYDLTERRLTAAFTQDSRMALSTLDMPTKVENADIVGGTTILTLDDLKARRQQEVAFWLAKTLVDDFYRDDGGNVLPWVFPQALDICRQWLSACLECRDDTFPQLLLFSANAHRAAATIYRAIGAGQGGQKVLKPVLRPYDVTGSTRYVDFDTVRPVYPARADKCHVSHVVADTDSWEQKMAQALEDMDEVVAYVKNHGLGFTIPYTVDGDDRSYYPDFIARVRDGGDGLLNLIVEVTGARNKDKEAKVSTARSLWAPAVSHHGGFGRWAFIETRDPWNAKTEIRAFVKTLAVAPATQP